MQPPENRSIVELYIRHKLSQRGVAWSLPRDRHRDYEDRDQEDRHRDYGNRDQEDRHRDYGNRDYGNRDLEDRHRDYGNRDYGNRDLEDRDYGHRDQEDRHQDYEDRDPWNRDSGHRDPWNRDRDSGHRDPWNRDSGHRDSGDGEWDRDPWNRDYGDRDRSGDGSLLEEPPLHRSYRTGPGPGEEARASGAAVHRVLRESGDELERLYRPDFTEMSRQLRLSSGTGTGTGRRRFREVLDELFRDGVSWGRVIAFFEFGAAVCVECAATKETRAQVDDIAEWMTEYLHGGLEPWIRAHGGWASFVSLYDLQQQNSLFSSWPSFKTMFGLAALGAASLSIGALLAQK